MNSFPFLKNLNAESLARIGNRKTRVVTHTSEEDRGGNKSIFCIFAEKCTACLKPLEEDGVFALGQLYHKACFRYVRVLSGIMDLHIVMPPLSRI